MAPLQKAALSRKAGTKLSQEQELGEPPSRATHISYPEAKICVTPADESLLGLSKTLLRDLVERITSPFPPLDGGFSSSNAVGVVQGFSELPLVGIDIVIKQSLHFIFQAFILTSNTLLSSDYSQSRSASYLLVRHRSDAWFNLRTILCRVASTLMSLVYAQPLTC